MVVASALAAYLIGAVPFSQLVARWRRGVDLRTVGTGTVSGTGLYRVAGIWVVLGGGLDVAKGAAAATLADGSAASAVAVSAAVVSGHCWSVFLRGAGGRGLSPAMGALAVLAWPGAVLLLSSLALGRLVRRTGLVALIADLLLVVLLTLTHGPEGTALAAAVVVPMLVKRLLGNAPAEGGLRTYRSRLLYDADAPADPGRYSP
jgi:glycerol-3-phosphate acyltransferase PlsY